jgi:serine/threonine-protein kinase
MATVFLARLPGAGGFERMVAIKRLHPHLERDKEFVEMFLDEARIAARIHHPNVVSTLEIGESERGYFLVMDYIEGTTLARVLSKLGQARQRMPLKVTLRVLHDALAGLHAAHELRSEDGKLLGLVHRDVSPQNVLIGLDGTSRITDFGVARAASRITTTRAGQLKGKLGYMSPEQARGEEVDRRADVFASGVLMWETLTGKRLFRGKTETDAETLSRVLSSEIPRVRTVNPEVSEAIDAVCARALERDISVRYSSCAEMIDALEAAAKGEMGSPRDVAKLLETVVGKEVEERREAIRNLGSGVAAFQNEVVTHTGNVPRLVPSSVSSASMSVATGVSGVTSGPVSVVMQAPPSKAPVAIGVLAGLLIVAVGGLGMVIFLMRSPPAVAPPNPPANSAPVVTATAPSASAPVTPPPPATADTPPAASSAPPASTLVPPGGKQLPGAGPATTKPKGGDGLSTNPYR